MPAILITPCRPSLVSIFTLWGSKSKRWPWTAVAASVFISGWRNRLPKSAALNTRRALPVGVLANAICCVARAFPMSIRVSPRLTSNRRTVIPIGVTQPRPRTRNPLSTPPSNPKVLQSTLASISCQASSRFFNATSKHFSSRPPERSNGLAELLAPRAASGATDSGLELLLRRPQVTGAGILETASSTVRRRDTPERAESGRGGRAKAAVEAVLVAPCPLLRRLTADADDTCIRVAALRLALAISVRGKRRLVATWQLGRPGLGL
mmetsp:Transcript_21905/g.55217  ORF Transcript_21905/g.55217 Transcript_21905/m.55217 type:complete len:266 (+) Transcript_21905:645-1442(+)